MGSNSRPELTEISILGRNTISFDELVIFLRGLPESTVLYLGNVRLRTGTWEEALDALRKEKPHIRMLSEPQGAECVGMSYADYRRIFRGADRYGGRSEAEHYFTNPDPRASNPLRVLRDGSGLEDGSGPEDEPDLEDQETDPAPPACSMM